MLGGMSQHDIGMNSATNDMSQHAAGIRRVTVEDAAKLLGLSENAIRKRVERGSLASERVDGTRYVLLDTDMSSEAHTLISEMRSRIEFLEDELRRKDTILMSLVSKVPELEASPQTRESSETRAAGATEGVETPLTAQKSSWFKRFFGL